MSIAAVGALLLALSATTVGDAGHARDGGTFLMATDGPQFDSVDPILFHLVAPSVVLRATCGQLLRTPDRSLPAAYRIVPEIAAGFPKVSDRGRTYTFTIRTGVRFSTGTVVSARDFAYTLNRILDPALKSPHVPDLEDVVGAGDVLAGRASAASGIVARGNKLIVRLKRPAGGFVALMAGPDSCVLPSMLPLDPEGVTAPVPSAGPYFISEFVPGQKVVLERNRFYRGKRPHRVERIAIDLSQDLATVIDKVERGELDYAWASPIAYSLRAEDLKQKYGVNRSRFFVSLGGLLRYFRLNPTRPLLRNNARLRQAINFAVDRKALLREWGPLAGTLTDQYLPPGWPGYRNERIYPLTAPDVARARALAKGHTRGGRLVLYVPDFPFAVAQGGIIKDDLKKIGLDVEVDALPPGLLFARAAEADMSWSGFSSLPPDASMVDLIANESGVDSPEYRRRLEHASRLAFGPARNRLYGRLDVDLARDVAPAVAYSFDTAMTLVSERTGCVVTNPWLDLAAVCIK